MHVGRDALLRDPALHVHRTRTSVPFRIRASSSSSQAVNHRGSAVNGAKIRSVWNGLLPRSRRGSRTQPRVSTRFQPWEPSNDVSLVSIIRRMGRHFQDTLLLLAGQPIRPVADPCAASSLIPAFRQHIVTIVALPSNARSDYVAWKLTSALNG